jgi:hypothetical protein
MNEWVVNKSSTNQTAMKRTWLSRTRLSRTCLSLAGLALCAITLLNLSSCAHSQQLVQVTVQPSGGFVFGGYGAQGQFTALGLYIHPPESKDITNKVVWSLDISNFATLTQTGQITYTRTDGCGSGNVTATYNSNPSDPAAGSVLTSSAPVSGGNNGMPACQ